jgi:ADP-glucose pyrophosphorylase
MGIYLFKKETLKQLFALNPAEHDFGKGIIPFAINKFYKVTAMHMMAIGRISERFAPSLMPTWN